MQLLAAKFMGLGSHLIIDFINLGRNSLKPFHEVLVFGWPLVFKISILCPHQVLVFVINSIMLHYFKTSSLFFMNNSVTTCWVKRVHFF